MVTGNFRKPQAASRDDQPNSAANPIFVTAVAFPGGGTPDVNVTDRATRLLGIVYGDVGQLAQRAASRDLFVQLRSAGVEIDPRQIRALTSADVVDVSDRSPRLLGHVNVDNLAGLATEATSSSILTSLGTDGAAAPVIPGTGVRGWLRSIYDRLGGTINVNVATPRNGANDAVLVEVKNPSFSAAEYARDSASGATDTGISILAINNRVGDNITTVQGRYSPLTVDDHGFLYVRTYPDWSFALRSITQTEFSEDQASTGFDHGQSILVVRNDAKATRTSADGDYTWIAADKAGGIFLAADKFEDAAAAGGDVGAAVLFVRNDLEADQTSADGDYGFPAVDKAGRVIFRRTTHSSRIIDGFTNADGGTLLTVPANAYWEGWICTAAGDANPIGAGGTTTNPYVSWAPGLGGTTAFNCAPIVLVLPASLLTGLIGAAASGTGLQHVVVYAGTTPGTFTLNYNGAPAAAASASGDRE